MKKTLDFIRPFLAKAELKQASFCSYGLTKTFKTLALMLLGALAFSNCADVPEPYNMPGSKNESGGSTGVTIEPAGDGTLASPYNVAAIVEKIKDMEAGVESAEEYYIKGKVSNVKTDAATIAQFGNHTFDMIDEGNKSTVFTAYQVYGPGKQKFTSVSDIKVGDEVVVCGKVVNYKGNTPETVGKGAAYVVSINSSGGGGETSQYQHISIAEFLEKADANTTYELTGKVSNIANTTFGNFDLVEDNASIYIYGLLDFNGNTKNFANLGIQEGDEITVTGKYYLYTDKDGVTKPEIVNAQLVSINGKGDNPGGETSGEGTKDSPYSVSTAMTKSGSAWVSGYIVGWVDGMTLSTGANFNGNSTVATNFLIADSPSETDVNNCMPVQLPSGSVRTALNLMDNPDNYQKEVLLYGSIEKYFGVAGLKSVSDYVIDGQDDEPQGEIVHITIADFLAKADTKTTYELTGKVSNIANTTFGNFDLVEDNASIYIYGLLDFNGNTKNFASLNIEEGDEITVTGKYYLYTDKDGVTKPEIVNAQIVSIKKGEGGNNDNPGGDTVTELINGDFESWVSESEATGWKSASTASSATIAQSTDRRSGSYACLVKANTAANSRLATQEITLAAGTYTFSFYAKAATREWTQVRIGYAIVPATTNTLTYKYKDGYVNIVDNEWTLVENEFTLSEETTVCLIIMNPKSNNASQYVAQDFIVDDATLTKK